MNGRRFVAPLSIEGTTYTAIAVKPSISFSD